jgi:hypothetical protein
VVYSGVLYICILAVGPTATVPSADATHWTGQGSPSGSLPSGRNIFGSLTWTLDGANSNYSASITNVSASLTANSKVVASLQRTTGSIDTTIQLATTNRLLAVETSSTAGGSIKFFVANGSDPTGVGGMSISWIVVAL